MIKSLDIQIEFLDCFVETGHDIETLKCHGKGVIIQTYSSESWLCHLSPAGKSYLISLSFSFLLC